MFFFGDLYAGTCEGRNCRNNMSAIVREVSVGNRVYVVRKPPTEVNESNHIVLQFLELLKNIDEYSDDEQNTREQVAGYIRRFQITMSFRNGIAFYALQMETD